MIYESRFWKEPLLSSSMRLKKLRITGRNQETAIAKVEKQLFIGFYSIRKLLETLKVSNSTKEFNLDVNFFHNKQPVDYFNRFELDELFDLSVSYSESKDIGFLCNQFIHSYIFMPDIAENGKINGFYVSSDRAKHTKLYYLSLMQVISIFRTVGNDYPNHGRFERNPKTLQWERIGD